MKRSILPGMILGLLLGLPLSVAASTVVPQGKENAALIPEDQLLYSLPKTETGDYILRCVDTLMLHGIDGVIATNTTIARKKVEGLKHAEETGGLSGAPLRERSTEVVRLVAEHVKGELPIIASGGVMSAADAVEKMEAGASLVQLFTGFIYEGPKLVADSVTAVAKWRREHA